MTAKEEEFLNRLRATFRMEAAEYLQTMTAELLVLEKAQLTPGNPTQYETIFRTAHSLKGASRAVNAKNIEVICQALESIFAGWKRGTLRSTTEFFDVLHKAVDLITGLVHSLGGKQSSVMAPAVTDLLSSLQVLTTRAGSAVNAGMNAGPDRASDLPPATNLASAGDNASPEEPSLAQPVERSSSRPLESIRIAVDKLDLALLEAEELLILKQAAKQRTSDLRDIRSRLVEWEREWSKFQPCLPALRRAFQHSKPEADLAPNDLLAAATTLIDFLEWNSAHLKSCDSLITAAQVSAKRDGHTAIQMVDELIDSTKRLVMQPVSTITDSLPLLVRQLGREKGKEIDLILRGGEVEIDKRILDELKDPLIHLVRNAIDHGVESPQNRRQCGKSASATLTITVKTIDDSKVEVSITDDGAGIDPEKVKIAAVKKGAISAEDALKLDHHQAISLIFQSDVTTSPMVTDISGRGLGLAIVREKSEKLGGIVNVETNLGKGTRFCMLLPIRLAAFTGLLVRVLDRTFILPAISVERVALVKKTDIKTVENRETISLKGRVVSLVRLATVLEISDEDAGPAQSDTQPVVVLGALDARVAFAVDEVLHDEEVLVKRLGPPLLRVRNVTGATVLSSGKLVPVLNPYDLLKSARKIGAGGPRARTDPGAAGVAQKPKSILVAEDSITSRTLIKGILESAGYQVKTAVNGVEALEALRTGTFDLVMSDVEMPRMNGFDLTARIRAERRLAEIPVVLVTALSSPEDRERGIDVGASAYIVKSDFDQSNLLEIVRRLV